MKKWLAIVLCVCLCLISAATLAEGSMPPEKPDGQTSGGMGGEPPEMPEGMGGTPPEMPEDGTPPEMPDGETPPEKPDGEMPGGRMGGPMGGAPESYDAVVTVTEDSAFAGELSSTGKDQNALLVEAGTADLTDVTVLRTSADSTGGDAGSFYGIGAALLVTGGTLNVTGGSITTDAAGGTGVFAYGSGTACVTDTVIQTAQNTSGAIHAAGGGTLYAANVTASTKGASSAAIRSDRGGGKMFISGGSFTTDGAGSPAVYVTADITVDNAVLTANGSEALCLEGRNRVTLTDCVLSGNMPDDKQNDNTWTVILYQSMSGDAEEGKGSFSMKGGKLISKNGGLFYTTNTESEFTLENVTIEAGGDCEYFLRCTGNTNARGWGKSGENGAKCVFTCVRQTASGNVIRDGISDLTLSLTEGSEWTGALLRDDSCALGGSGGGCSLFIEEGSRWIVTGDSIMTSLDLQGEMTDAEGRSVTVKTASGEILVQGEGDITVTVEEYSAS